jgi:hypothetical protein
MQIIISANQLKQIIAEEAAKCKPVLRDNTTEKHERLKHEYDRLQAAKVKLDVIEGQLQVIKRYAGYR